jgi:hypothetical protein
MLLMSSSGGAWRAIKRRSTASQRVDKRFLVCTFIVGRYEVGDVGAIDPALLSQNRPAAPASAVSMKGRPLGPAMDTFFVCALAISFPSMAPTPSR